MLHTDDIWAELTRRRIKAKGIAHDLGVATSTVTRAINGDTREPAPAILEQIAARIGVDVTELRPGRPAHRTPEDTGKTSRRSTVNTDPVQTAGRPGKGGSKAKTKGQAAAQAGRSPARNRAGCKEMAA